MNRGWLRNAAFLSAVVMVAGAIIALLNGNFVIAGTLLMFTAFAIYVWETNK